MSLFAKYYQRTLSDFFGSEKIHSGNLYQLMSYLTNTTGRDGDLLSGMLVYPQVGKPVNETYRIQGFDVTVYTLNLNQPWQAVHSEITTLLG